jgi:2-haloacid dehalogenase
MTHGEDTMPHICVFDVNETLLDLRGLDPAFTLSFGDADARREWFSQVLQSALVTTLLSTYVSFSEIGGTALEMTAARRGVELVKAERHRMLSGMRRLPAHEDVADGLDRLRTAGLRLVALTNSTQDTAEAGLTHAGLRGFFEQVFSADSVRRLKPAPEPYRMVAERLGVPVGQLRLIAAHAWDVAGALRAGCAAAFVARPGLPFDPLLPRPDIVGMDVRDVAEQIVALEGAA